MANEIIKTMNEKDFTAEEIQAFNEQYLEGMKKIAHLEHVKKSFEEQEKFSIRKNNKNSNSIKKKLKNSLNREELIL